MLATNFLFSSSHVLFGKLRPNLNKVVKPYFNGLCTTEILPLLPDNKIINKYYLWAFLLSNNFVNWAKRNVSGAQLPRLDPKILADYILPVPNLKDQKEFEKIVVQYEKNNRLLIEAERQAEQLFQGMLREAFEQ